MNQLFFKYNPHLFLILILLFSSLGCEKKSNSIIDSSGNAPTLFDVRYSINVVNTDNIYVGDMQKPEDLLTIRDVITAKVTHFDGQEMVKAVRFSVLNSESSIVIEGLLNDGGLSSDIKAKDSIYSGYIAFDIKRVVVGTYYINLWSESKNGYLSNTLMLPIKIIRFNHPPVISNLQAPENLSLGSMLKLTVQVNDSDGIADISSVGFVTRKPDGNYANDGNLIPMFDDGKPDNPSGDATAKDGIYTYTTNVPSDAKLGTYIYTFYALDRSRAISNQIEHRIEIK